MHTITLGAFHTSDSNTPGYYIVQWTGNAYTLQEKYICHEFDSPVIIPEGGLVCPAKSMTPTRKTSHWYHKIDEAIPIMVKLKQVLMPYIKLIQHNNTKNNFPSHFRGYADRNPHVLSEHDHQIILYNIEANRKY